MKGSSWVRQIHRWASVVFTAGVIIVSIIVASGGEEPAEWVYTLPLLPLGVLLLTGLYLFAQPYATRLRRGRSNRTATDGSPGAGTTP